MKTRANVVQRWIFGEKNKNKNKYSQPISQTPGEQMLISTVGFLLK